MHHNKLFKVDTKGKMRVWWMETDGANYRTHSGVLHGKIVVSGWTLAEAKNQGKANSTTGEEQALLEVESTYRHKLYQGKYHESAQEADVGEKKFISPMLAKTYNDKTTFPVYSQPKLNGTRCVASIDGLFTRNGKPIVSVPHIMDALKPMFEKYPDLVFDGELYNHELRENLERSNSLARKKTPTDLDLEESKILQYHVYDFIDETKSFTDRFFNFNHEYENDYIQYVYTTKVYTQNDLDDIYSIYLSHGYEGQMIRDPDALYESKRSSALVKRKTMQDIECKILSIKEGIGNWAGYAKSVEIELPNGNIQESGMQGNQDFAKKLLEEKDEYVNGIVTIRFQEYTQDGKLWFPIAVAFFKGERDM